MCGRAQGGTKNRQAIYPIWYIVIKIILNSKKVLRREDWMLAESNQIIILH
jgi:hypothetical protein